MGKEGEAMNEPHLNTLWLMSWNNRMVAKYGQPNTNEDWCRKLAYYMGEEGNDVPSNAAIEIARKWEIAKP